MPLSAGFRSEDARAIVVCDTLGPMSEREETRAHAADRTETRDRIARDRRRRSTLVTSGGCFATAIGGGVALVLALGVYSWTADPMESATAWVVRHFVFGERTDAMLPADTPIDRLEELLGSNRMEVHTVAANRLKQLGSADPFLHSLRADDPGRRRVAAHWLMSFPEPRVREALRAACEDDDEYARGWAAFSLGRIGEVEDIELLHALRGDPSPVVRMWAEEAIADLRQRGVDAGPAPPAASGGEHSVRD